MAGEFWLRTFRKKYGNEISLRKPEATSLARATAFNRSNVATFFNNFKKCLEDIPQLSPFNIWNLDESGISTVHVPPKILTTKGLKKVGSVTNAERGANITLIAAVNAGGGFMPPMLIFPRVNFKDYMIKGAPPGTIGAANPSGWSNETLFLIFFKHFVKFSGSNKDNRTLLLLDNHESHISIPVIQMAKDNGVTLLTFHPHTSHKMQPLDCSVFGPFKAYYNIAMNEWMIRPGNIGKPATIYDVAELIGQAFPLAFTPTSITNGFKKTGICPLNENVFPDHEFLSSEMTNRPYLCPDELPSSSSSFSKPIQSILTSTPVKTYASPSKTTLTPDEIVPFPKALARKNTSKGRKKKKSCILTDTPEKIRIEVEKSAKRKQEHLPKTETSKTQRLKNINFEELNSEPEFYGNCETLETGKSNMEFSVKEDIDEEEFEVGNYVLAKKAGKKCFRYFVAEIVGIRKYDLEVKYLKRIKNSPAFHIDKDSIYELGFNDVVLRLPKPTVSLSTYRKQKKVFFSADLTTYNVE